LNRTDAILSIVAVEVGNSNHGGFLKHMAAAWQNADRQNKRIIKPAWLVIVDRYKLEEEYSEAIKEHLPEYMEAEDR